MFQERVVIARDFYCRGRVQPEQSSTRCSKVDSPYESNLLHRGFPFPIFILSRSWRLQPDSGRGHGNTLTSSDLLPRFFLPGLQ
jgi:hypothetical protein